MTTKHKYVGGSILVVLLGIGIVIYLVRRKPGVIDKSEYTYFFETTVPETSFPSWNDTAQPESDVARMVRISDAAIAADDAQEKM